MPSYNHHNRHISTNKNAHSSGYFYIITYARQLAVVWRPRLRKAMENTQHSTDLWDEFVVIRKVRATVHAAVGAMTLAGQVRLERLHHFGKL